MQKLILPVSILLGCFILGGFYFAAQVYKQNTIIRAVSEEITAREIDTQENIVTPITSEDVANFLSSTGEVLCNNGSGSGFFWQEPSGIKVITNQHVIESDTECQFLPQHAEGNTWAAYKLDLSSNKPWNQYTDVAKLTPTVINNGVQSPPVSVINDSGISKLRKCPDKLPQGTPLVLIGYPAFAERIAVAPNTGLKYKTNSRQITDGIISGYDDTEVGAWGSLKYSNYYVSAKIDSGNSGGPAFAKDQDGLCFLGIATWLNVGNYETQGIVQNILNILNEE